MDHSLPLVPDGAPVLPLYGAKKCICQKNLKEECYGGRMIAVSQPLNSTKKKKEGLQIKCESVDVRSTRSGLCSVLVWYITYICSLSYFMKQK